MGILLVVFAISIGYATFLENDFDAKTARLLIYNAWWFEAVMVLMIVNFSGMIFSKKLYRFVSRLEPSEIYEIYRYIHSFLNQSVV